MLVWRVGSEREASLTLILEGTEFRNLLGVGAYGPRIKALIFGLKKLLF